MDEITEILERMAKGYYTKEVSTKDGDQVVKTKHVPPCMTAIKMLDARRPKQQDDFALMTRSELIAVTKKILEGLESGEQEDSQTKE